MVKIQLYHQKIYSIFAVNSLEIDIGMLNSFGIVLHYQYYDIN